MVHFSLKAIIHWNEPEQLWAFVGDVG